MIITFDTDTLKQSAEDNPQFPRLSTKIETVLMSDNRVAEVQIVITTVADDFVDKGTVLPALLKFNKE